MNDKQYTLQGDAGRPGTSRRALFQGIAVLTAGVANAQEKAAPKPAAAAPGQPAPNPPAAAPRPPVAETTAGTCAATT